MVFDEQTFPFSMGFSIIPILGPYKKKNYEYNSDFLWYYLSSKNQDHFVVKKGSLNIEKDYTPSASKNQSTPCTPNGN